VASERFHPAAAVYGVLRDASEQVLLLRRAGSGYHDGELSLPAGHLDGGEDAVSGLVRELGEELLVEADPDACRLALVMHRAPEVGDGDEYIDLFFTVGRWTGRPQVGEPDKATELLWAHPRRLPLDVVDYVARALHAIDAGEPLLLHGWAGRRSS
jgi:8-oxo-dGTP diphosphatase